MEDCIHIKGARVNNLKNISVDIPRGKMVVITGLSGSGKSSLAFDTLYAEGQRRYVESLNAYARQFLGRMSKPECDYIKGIPPAIAIEQKVISRNSRSTVGTSTEIYDYLRMLFARIGHTFSPVSGQEVKKHSAQDVVDFVLSHPEGEKFMILCPICQEENEPWADTLLRYQKNGFTRLLLDGETVRISDLLERQEPCKAQCTELLVDRLSVNAAPDTISRLTDSAETAFYEGRGEMSVRFVPSNQEQRFSIRFEADGITFQEPSDQLFAFNSPMGACPDCEGFGKIIGIDEQLVIPNSALSVYEGCVVCWRGDKMSEWKQWFIRFNSMRGFPVHKPYFQLTQQEKDWLWHGTPISSNQATQGVKNEKLGGADVHVPANWELTREEREWGLISIDAFFEMLRQSQYKIQNRVMLARYRGKTVCPLCHGTRLRPEANYVRINGRTISELIEMPIKELIHWFDHLELNEHDSRIGERLLTEIRNRLNFLMSVGLSYLTLNRPSNSLSGGESQRINLATSLGSSLVGSLYILDEPSIGLHSRDTQQLIQVLHELRDLGNTVVVVEHDEEIIRSADWVIEIGPQAGRLGGEVVYEGQPKQEPSCIPTPRSRRPWNNYIEVQGARANNLKGIDVRFPLNVLTCITGVSGSGKSSLVRDILYLGMKRALDEVADRPGEHLSIKGDLNMVKAVEFIDQNPIGKSTRSNPVTYVKAWDEIRKLMADQPLSKQMGYTAGFFSFNTEGGRCEMCKGEGTTTVEMQFMADLHLVCEACHGKRFKSDLLEVTFHGQNVYDMLNMTVNQAIEFFTEHKQRRIVDKLKPLQDVGLGYIKLGQSSSTLSGGENQRVKLAYYIGQERQEPTLFIFDEPTTGLHTQDIAKLLTSFDALLQRGHTLVVIEHNLDVIKCADHLIDLGPEGGLQGGQLVFCGTPEEIVKCEQSYTGQFLRECL